MKLFENGVGRPSNEIKRKRKIFIASVVGAIALLLVVGGALLFGNLDTDRLQGASDGTAYIDLSVKNSAISASGCNITIPYQIENRSKQKISVYSAKLTTSDKKTLVSKSVSGSVPAGKGNTNTIYVTYNSKNLPTSGKIRTVIYFKVNGKEYWHTEYVTPSSSVYSTVKTCQGSSQNGNAYVDLHVTDSKIYTNHNCKLVVPARVVNKSNQKITITDAKITSQWTTSTVYATAKKTGSIAAGKNKETTVNFEFPVTGTAFPRAEQEFKVVVYYQVNGKGRYYIVDQIDTPNTAEEKIKHCKDRNGNSYANHHVENDVITVDGNCNLVVKAKLKNKSDQKLTAVSAKLTSNNNETTYVTAKASGDTVLKNKNSSIYTTFKFSQAGAKNAIAKEGSTIRMVTYFKVNTYATPYWITENITISKTIQEQLNSCKVNTKVITINCPESRTAGTEFTCETNMDKPTITISAKNALASSYPKVSGKKVSIKFNDNLFTKYKNQIKKDSTGSYIKVAISASKSGNGSATDHIKIYQKKTNNSGSASSKTVSLECPDSAKTYEHFLCKTDQSGVKITVGGADALSTTSSFTTTSSDMTKSIEYTNVLFTDGRWKSQKDSNGKEYINAKITASKSGYKTTTKYVKIYKGTAPSNNSSGNSSSGGSSTSTTLKSGMKITCTSATVDKDFTCKTNVSGATIKTKATKYLKKGYKTSSKNSLKLNYTINGTITLTATASGYKDATATIKVNKANISKLTCTTAYLNEDFTCKSNVSGATITTNGTTYLKKGYSKSSNKNSLKLNYTKTGTIKVTASKSGYNSKSINVKVTKRSTTASKNDDFAADDLYYGIYKVMKNEEFGSKTLEFKINKVGKDVKKVQWIVCNDKEQCINYNTNSNNFTTGLQEAKVGNVYKLNIFTLNDELLNQRFYVRMISYDKDGKEIYFKVHEFYTNLTTDKSSPNKSIGNEADVQIGDFTGATHDFIYSEHSIKELKTGRLNYGIPSIAKLDNNGKKQLNVFIKEWASDVKYVTYVVCNSKDDCNKSDVIEQVSKNNEMGTVVKDIEVSRGNKIEIQLNSKSDNLLKEKIYVRIFTYDENKTTLYTKMHEFAISSSTKAGTKKESDIKVGERASTSLKFLSSNTF